MEKSYAWFEKRRRTKILDLAQEQITNALDTITLLDKAISSLSNNDKKESVRCIDKLFEEEEEVDRLRREIFKQLSKGTGPLAESREDLMHLVKRLDTIADFVKDAARCIRMLSDTQIPRELLEQVKTTTSMLVDCAQTLRSSIEKITANPNKAIQEAKKVEEIESEIDKQYLLTKPLFIKYAETMNIGAMLIFDDMVEFIEEAADMCADTADYILILASEE